VDDSPIVRNRLAGLIGQACPAVIHEAEDGFCARSLFAEHHPDVVFLDLQVPGATGIELLSEFKARDARVVVIVLTTFPFKELRERCRALGADYFYDKATEFEKALHVLASFHLVFDSAAKLATWSHDSH
jgi:DNA-binding NarL/FixJ family response regulator